MSSPIVGIFGKFEGVLFFYKNFQEKVKVDSKYFKIDLFDDGSPRNIFWADGRSRDAYLKFGDVVVFDVTYLTNKFKFPFAPFVGVNHHGQSIIFGGALLENEKEETFKWLFEQFLKCMFNKFPVVDTQRAAEEDENFKTMNSRQILSYVHPIEAKASSLLMKKHVETLPDHYILSRWTLDCRYKVSNANIRIEETNCENGVGALTLWYVQANWTNVIEQKRDALSEIKRLNNFLVKFLEDQMIRKKPTEAANADKDTRVGTSQVDTMPQISVVHTIIKRRP
nr:hypothetical protein [Tanacetum cinerariifolium]